MAKKINGNAHLIYIWYKVSLNSVQLGDGLMLLVNLLHWFAKSRKCHVAKCRMPEVFSLTSDKKRRERGSAGHTFAALPLNSIAPKEGKKTSGTQGSCKSDIFKLKFDQRSFVRLERIALCIEGTPQKCTKFCQQPLRK